MNKRELKIDYYDSLYLFFLLNTTLWIFILVVMKL